MFTKYNLVVRPIKPVDKALYQTANHLCMSIAARHEQGRPSCYFLVAFANAESYYTEDHHQAKNYHIEALWRFQCLVSKQSDEDDSHTMQELVQGMDTVVLFRCFNKL